MPVFLFAKSDNPASGSTVQPFWLLRYLAKQPQLKRSAYQLRILNPEGLYLDNLKTCAIKMEVLFSFFC